MEHDTRREGQPLGRNLGIVLASDGLITEDQLAAVLVQQRETGDRLSSLLVRLGHLTEEQLAEFLSRKYRIPLVALADTAINPDVIGLIPASFARKHQVIPTGQTGRSVTLAMADPTNLTALDEASFSTGLKVVPVIARASAIRRAIDEYYGSDTLTLAEVLGQAQTSEVEIVGGDGDVAAVDVQELRSSADDVPVVRLVNRMILEAIRAGASDVHLEPDTTTFHVRIRVDGMLREIMNPSKRLEPAVVSRLKIMANLDIAERRLPQDGRTKLRSGGREIDLRVNTLPMALGEGVAIRILDREAVQLNLATLGIDEWSATEFRKAIQSPYGMIVITGPTGSGKTTTLYAAVEALKAPTINILTIEDPVEYNLRGVNQVQVNEAIGLTFAGALRAFLRHDPDVVLVGEIRDLETAQIAARAALTGHLVMTTLHTNDSATAIARLRDMGIPSYLLE
ncbi:MAG: Flp pilus assembly complex ATPase component TadA, partial [Candidatus Rokubacteria bacterium]|nr:Flp pilus assembly complex ATPase component TadA [Candidatus Rokubacteria bacterium]